MTLDPDVDALIKRAMGERGLGFKDVLNEAIRHALADDGAGGDRFGFSTFDMGLALVPLDHALELAASLEDEERRRKIAQRR